MRHCGWAQARAQDGVDERAATAKLRRHKRKSAEMEPAAPTISITATAHAGMQDAPRCAPRSLQCYATCCRHVCLVVESR